MFQPTLNSRAVTILMMLLQAKQDRKPMPTMREMMDRTGLRSPNGIRGHLKRLEKMGLVFHWEHNTARSWVPCCTLEKLPRTTQAIEDHQ